MKTHFCGFIIYKILGVDHILAWTKALLPLRLLKGGALVVGIEVVVLAILSNAVQVAIRVEKLLPALGQVRGKEGGEVSSKHLGIVRLGLEPSKSLKSLLKPLKNFTLVFWPTD